jgi:arylsulfatase A-like enzyme/cytochrome c-type biogenesis protein CcmH/NrfG
LSVRRPKLAVALACAIAIAVAVAGCRRGGSPAGAPAPPPSIVLISIDTLRSDRLPAYGYAAGSTPAIDALRRDSVLFSRAYANVPLTLPSHASLLTGLLPAGHGVRDNVGYRLDASQVPYAPELLRRAGYATGAAMSSYVLRSATGLAAGFDLYDDHFTARTAPGPGGVQRAGRETLARARDWLRASAQGRFFFLLHLYEPHTPYEPPPEFAHLASRYDGEVAAADQVVGELVAELRSLGVYDRAAILLVSDHGEGLGDHGESTHGILLYRESLQVPLLLKLPGGRRAGATVDTPVQLVDVLPTLAGLAGAPPPERADGISLLPLLDGEPGAAAPRPIYAETYYPRLHFGWSELVSAIEGGYHLIDGPDPELYDLAADPGERRSLRDAERRRFGELRQQLAGYERRFAPPAPADEETRRSLAALGYLGGAPAPASGPLPDPKSRIHTLADLDQGLRWMAERRFAEAVAALERAVAAHPQLVDGWESLALAQRQLGRLEEALQSFGRAIELSGGTPELAVPAGMILLRLERPADALRFVREQRAKFPDEVRLGLLEAQALMTLERLPEALAAAEALLRRHPDDADANYQVGVLRMAKRDLAGAEPELRRALELAPDHTAALNDLAVLLQAQGRAAEAEALLAELVRLRPGDRRAAASLERLRRERDAR